MKRFRKFVSLLTAAGLLALLPGSASLTVRADDPVTYSVKFTSGETNCWCYVTGSTFDMFWPETTAPSAEISSMPISMTRSLVPLTAMYRK